MSWEFKDVLKVYSFSDYPRMFMYYKELQLNQIFMLTNQLKFKKKCNGLYKVLIHWLSHLIDLCVPARSFHSLFVLVAIVTGIEK